MSKLDESMDLKPFSQWMDEDAPANAAGGGGVAGIGIGVHGEPGVDLRKRKKDHPALQEAVEKCKPFSAHDWHTVQASQTASRHIRMCDKCGAKMTQARIDQQTALLKQKQLIDTIRKRERGELDEETKPDDQFAGADVFEVDTNTTHKSRFGKNRYHRYSTYVGEHEKAEAIRQHGRSTKKDIILKDGTTGAMVYLRRKQQKNK